MSRLLIPTEIIETMVCIKCCNYLSFFPVYIKSDGSGAICGRCKITDEDAVLHDTAYEGIAQFLQFPCRYKSSGCKEWLSPLGLIDHEISCNYRKFDCPTKIHTKCEWTGTCVNLKKHFQEKHPSLLLNNNQFELDFTTSYKKDSLMCSNNELFIVKEEMDSFTESFTCSVKHFRLNDKTEHYDYFLRLTSGNLTFSTRCPTKSTTEGNNITKFNNQFVKEKLQDPMSVLINIEIIKANCEIPEGEVPTKDVKWDPNINWDLLGELECPICFDFMLPPIYQCINGHSICSECKPKVNECPICKNGIQDTKNFALEKMTQYLMYPCKFFKSGCTYSTKATNIRTHEGNCEFGPYDCPLREKENCVHKLSLSEIVSHIDHHHATFILNSNKINIPFDMAHDQECFYLINMSGKVFKLHFKYADKKFMWSLQLVGPVHECKKYKFDVDVVDNSGNKLRYYVKGFCVPLTDKAKAFTDTRNYLMLIYEQVAPMITETFSFQVRIVKD